MIGQASLTDRSSFIRVVRHHDGVRCELVSVVRRRPRRRSIPLSTATAMAGSGTPIVVRRCQCLGDSPVESAPAVTVR